MTTNQTIDGVPRGLLERVVGKASQTPHWDALDEDRIAATAELRALLDERAAPVAPCAIADALESAQWPNTSIGNKVLVAAAITELRKAAQPQGDPLSELEVLRAAVKELEAMRDARIDANLAQGEPVAVMYADGSVLTKSECGIAFETCCKVETPLYTEQPAPVAVVLPERRNFSPQSDSEWGWNACLDEVTRLNPSL